MSLACPDIFLQTDVYLELCPTIVAFKHICYCIFIFLRCTKRCEHVMLVRYGKLQYLRAHNSCLLFQIFSLADICQQAGPSSEPPGKNPQDLQALLKALYEGLLH